MKTAIFLVFLAIGMGAATLTYLSGGFVLMVSGLTFLTVMLGALVAIALRAGREHQDEAIALSA